MKKSSMLWFLPILGLLAMPVVARDYDHGYGRLDNRLERQELRIERGVRNGQLTDEEAAQLHKALQKTLNKERKYLRDGVLSREERRALAKRLDKSDQLMRQLLHNDRYRGYSNRKPRRYDDYRHDRYRNHDDWRYGPERHRYGFRYEYPDPGRHFADGSYLLDQLDLYRYDPGDRYAGKDPHISDWLYLLDRLSR
jgi:hypothetical protein